MRASKGADLHPRKHDLQTLPGRDATASVGETEMTGCEQAVLDAAVKFGNTAKASRDAYDRKADADEGRRIAIAFYEAQRDLHAAAKLLAAEKRK